LKTIKLRHIGIVVKDIKKNIKIFKSLFGIKLKSKISLQSGNYISNLVGFKKTIMKTCILKISDNNRIELIEYVNPKSYKKKISPNNIGVSHFAITIKSMKTFLKKYKKFKIKLLHKPILNEDKSAVVVYAIINKEIICEVVQVIKKKATFSGGK
tara:strand:+ start:832 stop:1296 length:465 start_codon:yes stop_codon:yes gene_type:complete